MSQLVEDVRLARSLPPRGMAKAIRRSAGVSQERMAAELGVHRVTIARWESGDRVPTGAHRLAYASLLRDLLEVTK